MRKLDQKTRVLRAALTAGERGICQVDFYAPNVIDGRAPITRLAARIGELQDEGIRFVDGGRRHGTKVYKLDRASLADATRPPEPPAAPIPGAQGVSSQPAPEAGGSGGSLFDMPTTAQTLDFDRDICPPPPRSAIQDWEDAA